jgi:hypothetical protein
MGTYRVKVKKPRFAPLGVPLKFEANTNKKTKKKKTNLEARRSSNKGSCDERWTRRLKFRTKGGGTSNEETQTVRTFGLRLHLAKETWNGGS